MIEPMLAESREKPFDSPGWLFEPKLDGVRCVAVLNGDTRLYSRSGREVTAQFPELQEAHRLTTKPCVVDGEIIALNGSFNFIQERVHKTNATQIAYASKSNPCIYYLFDILDFDGASQCAKPLYQRKVVLDEAITGAEGENNIHKLGGVEQWGRAIFEKAADMGFEGVMAKRITSTYQTGRRSPDWLKIKAFKEETFVICGVTLGEGDRAKTFGSLVLGKEQDGGELVYMGNVGSGFTEPLLHSLSDLFDNTGGECPFPATPDTDREVKMWLQPFLKCEVRFLGLGSEGKLRFPTFRRFVSQC